MKTENEEYIWQPTDVPDITDQKQISLPVGESENEILQVICAINEIKWTKKVPQRAFIIVDPPDLHIPHPDPEINFYCKIDRIRDLCDAIAVVENTFRIPCDQHSWNEWCSFKLKIVANPYDPWHNIDDFLILNLEVKADSAISKTRAIKNLVVQLKRLY